MRRSQLFICSAFTALGIVLAPLTAAATPWPPDRPRLVETVERRGATTTFVVNTDLQRVLPGAVPLAIHSPAPGRLWIAAKDAEGNLRMVLRSNGRLTVHEVQGHRGPAQVSQIVGESANSVWANSAGRLLHFDGRTWRSTGVAVDDGQLADDVGKGVWFTRSPYPGDALWWTDGHRIEEITVPRQTDDDSEVHMFGGGIASHQGQLYVETWGRNSWASSPAVEIRRRVDDSTWQRVATISASTWHRYVGGTVQNTHHWFVDGTGTVVMYGAVMTDDREGGYVGTQHTCEAILEGTSGRGCASPGHVSASASTTDGTWLLAGWTEEPITHGRPSEDAEPALWISGPDGRTTRIHAAVPGASSLTVDEGVGDYWVLTDGTLQEYRPEGVPTRVARLVLPPPRYAGLGR